MLLKPSHCCVSSPLLCSIVVFSLATGGCAVSIHTAVWLTIPLHVPGLWLEGVQKRQLQSPDEE